LNLDGAMIDCPAVCAMQPWHGVEVGEFMLTAF
jgi:hypothetical protein